MSRSYYLYRDPNQGNSIGRVWIQVFPSENLKMDIRERSDETRTAAGIYVETLSVYQRQWTVDLRHVSLDDAEFIYTAWAEQNRCIFQYYEGVSSPPLYCIIANDDSPIISAELPYDNRFHIRLELMEYIAHD